MTNVTFERESTGSLVSVESDNGVFISPSDDPDDWVPIDTDEIEWVRV
jgi:hypothetical protein